MYNLEWSAVCSASAFALAQVAKEVATMPLADMVTTVSSIVFCLIGVVKFIDLLFDKIKKWRGKTESKRPSGQ